jgi:hypothetical protein
LGARNDLPIRYVSFSMCSKLKRRGHRFAICRLVCAAN